MNYGEIQALKHEVICGMPTKRAMEVVSVGAFEIFGKRIVIKNRYTDYDLDEIILKEGFIKYDNNNVSLVDNFQELLAKNVIFNKELLNKRGLLALIKLAEVTK